MAVYRSSIRDARDYSGPLLGFEIEAYALNAITVDDGWGEACDRTLLRVAKHLRRTTGLPFKPIIETEYDTKPRETKNPNSSLANPVWGVTRDASLDPLDYDDGCIPGVELVTPPLSPCLSLECLTILRQGVFPWFEPGDFVADPHAGLHINASVPNLSRETAGVAILNPYSSLVPYNRRARFADTLFTAVVGVLLCRADSPEEAIDAFLKLAAQERGWHPTNPGPFLKGRGYIEFRHLGSEAFEEGLRTINNFCWKIIGLLSNPPKAKMLRRAEQALDIAKRIRCLDVEDWLGSARSLMACPSNQAFENDKFDLKESGFVDAVFDICLSDSKLSEAFPWVRIYGAYLANPTGFNDVKMVRQIPPQSYYLRSHERHPSFCLSETGAD